MFIYMHDSYRDAYTIVTIKTTNVLLGLILEMNLSGMSILSLIMLIYFNIVLLVLNSLRQYNQNTTALAEICNSCRWFKE